MAALRVLAVAVASGKAAYVYLENKQLVDWRIITKATKSGADLVGYMQGVINDSRPEVVVTESCGSACRKGRRTQALIQSIAELASHNTVLDISVPLPRTHPSKYEAAKALAAQHPVIVSYLPGQKRRIFDFEPRSMILFEALALAEHVYAPRQENAA